MKKWSEPERTIILSQQNFVRLYKGALNALRYWQEKSGAAKRWTKRDQKEYAALRRAVKAVEIKI